MSDKTKDAIEARYKKLHPQKSKRTKSDAPKEEKQ